VGAHRPAQARAPAGERSHANRYAERVVRNGEIHACRARGVARHPRKRTAGRLREITGGRARLQQFALPQLSRLGFIERRNKVIHEGPLLDLAFDYAEFAPRILEGALSDLLKQRGVLESVATPEDAS